MPLPGTEPATQARALIGSQTSGQNDTQSPRQPTNLSLAGQVSCPLSDHVPLCLFFFFLTFSFFCLTFYLFIFWEEEGRRKKGRDTSICGCLLHTPYWGPDWASNRLPRGFAGQHSIHWATPARAIFFLYQVLQARLVLSCPVLESTIAPRSCREEFWREATGGECEEFRK